MSFRRPTLRMAGWALLITLGGGVLIAFRPAWTPAIRPGAPDARPVAELRRIKLGGVPQTVLVRGADDRKPVLLFLHGGPGMPVMYLAHAAQREIERDFVVVHWDRRGAGKSWDAREPAESLSVRRTLDDLFELTGWLRRRFPDRRPMLVAHSWGTYLGLLAVRARPDWFRAYIGMGQVVPDASTARETQRKLVQAAAAARGDSALAARLAIPGTRPTEAEMFQVEGELVGATSYWPLLRAGLLAPEYTLRDVLSVPRGARHLLTHLRRDADDRWLSDDPAVGVPVVFILGRHDMNTPSALAAAWLDTLRAPYKEVVWFEQSAHFPFFEEPARFHTELRRIDARLPR